MSDRKTDLPYHLDHLAALCRRHTTNPKFLFCARDQVGYNVLNALARSGVDWVNLEAMSPRDHAKRRFDPALRASGLRPLAPDLAVVTVADLLLELKDAAASTYFEPVGVTPSLARSVWETLQALRLAGITRRHLESSPIRTEKTKALAYLLGRLEDVLKDGSYYDDAFVIQYALRSGNSLPVDGFAAVLDEAPMTDGILQYLRQSFGDRLVRIGRSEYGVPIPETVAAFFMKTEPVPDGAVGPAGTIKSEDDVETISERIHVFGSRGPEAEVGDVLRYCLEHKIPLDDVEIAYSNASVYVPLMLDLGDRFRLEVSFSEGIPASLTRPGAGLKGFLDWIASNCRALDLIDMMRAGTLSFHRSVEGVAPFDMLGLADHLRLAVLDEGIERYVPAIERLAASRRMQTSDAGETRFEKRARLLVEAMESLKKLVPTSSKLSLSDVAEICRRFLDDFAVEHGERDKRATESLRDRFDELGRTSREMLPKRLALQLAADMVDRHRVQASVARDGSLHAVSVEQAGYSGRGHMFVIGLDVDNFPGRSAEDPILLDIERKQLSAHLDLKSSQATDRIWHLIRALGMAEGHVYFGSSVFNAEREEAVIYPSPFFQAVAKQCRLNYLEPPPLSGNPFRLDDTDVLLPQRKRRDYREIVEGRFPWMQRGAVAVDARKNSLFTAFDGWIDEQDETIGRGADGPVFSPNRLEKLAACPYRYFLHYVLGIRKPDYYEPDPTRWLSPREFGTLLHDLYHDFLRDLSEKNRRPDPARDRGKLLAMLAELIERYATLYPPDNQAAFEYERQRLERSVTAFLRTEALDPDARPVFFELVFGSEDATKDSLLEPVLIRLGADLAFPLRGRIDRVDVLPDDTTAIWDYKTGSSYAFDQGSLLRGGLNLQWVLYAYAVEELADALGLPREVSRSGYYFANDRENGRKIAENPPDRGEMYQVLLPLFELVRTGAFLHVTKSKGECRFCDFRPVCEKEAKMKKDLSDAWGTNAEQPFLSALSEWMEYE